MSQTAHIAIVGSGPAALMAADRLSRESVSVTIYEKRKSPGRKLLVAGSSGLNVTHDAPIAEFARAYRSGISPRAGETQFWEQLLSHYSPQDWLRDIESMGISTFRGTSPRYFIEDKRAANFLQTWIQRLRAQGVSFQFEHEACGLSRFENGKWEVRFVHQSPICADAVLFALGGGSWEPNEKPLRWPQIFREHGVGFEEFSPSNSGHRVAWSKSFLREAEGQPIKNVTVTSLLGTKKGELMITSYGLEGTPIYTLGEIGEIILDLKPDQSPEQITSRLAASRENLSPIRRVQKLLNLSPGANALLFHETPEEVRRDLAALISRIKRFPLTLLGPQPLDESISARGGVLWSELTADFMFQRLPGVFAAGEMLNWDAPTGGFLIQGCVTQGFCAAEGAGNFLARLQRDSTPRK